MKGIFNILHLSQGTEKEIILCESIIDAISFWDNGYKNVTCSFGVNGFTDELFNFFLEKNIQKVYIAFDSDDAGEKAAERLNQKLSSHNIQCYRVPLPPQKDVKNQAKDILKKEKEFLAVNIGNANDMLKKLRKKKERILNLYLDGNLDRISFLNAQHEIDKATEMQKDVICRHEKSDLDFNTKISDLVDVFLYLPEEYFNSDKKQKARILKRLTEKILVDRQKSVKIEFKAPYNLFISDDICSINKATDISTVRTYPVLRGESS